eukprot:s7640_g5.t1
MRRCAPYFIRSPWCVALMSGMGTTSAEQEITSLFAAYLPSLSTAAPLGKRQGAPARRDPPKHRRPESKGASGALGKGKGKGSRGGGSSQPGSASNQSPIPNLQEEEGIKEVIRMLMQVSIRHEDHINLLRLQDRSFLLWMKTSSPESMLPTIVAASKAWKEKREAGTTDTSLRVTLFRCLLVELKNRATQMVENSELRAKLMTAGEKEIMVPDQGPMAQSDAISQIDKLLEGIDSLTLQRFHSTRPLTDDYRSEMACFLLEISNRGTMATRLHQAMVTLCHSSVMFLIGDGAKPRSAPR